MKKLLLALVLVPTLLFSQSRKERKALEAQQKADQLIIGNFKMHAQNLAIFKSQDQSNSQNVQEKAITEYISNQFTSLGLLPKGANGYIQAFNIPDGKKIDVATFLKVNDHLLEINKEYFPLSYSAEKKVTGMPAMALRERGVPWFVDIKDWLEDGSGTETAKTDDAIVKEATKVASKGATALFVYNSSSLADGLIFSNSNKTVALPIPVIYITPEGYKKYFNDHSQVLDIELNVAFTEKTIPGSNVAGFIDNAAPTTIVIGTHYNQAFIDTNRQKTQAAKTAVLDTDNNTGRIALLIELARMLAATKAKSNNYLFIAFGGSDKGITASNFLLETTITPPPNYMIDLDIMDSYNENPKLSVQGAGSSPIWKDVLTSIPDKNVAINLDEANMAANASTAFFKKGIPALSFATVAPADGVVSQGENRPINYAADLQIARFIDRLIALTDTRGRIAFEKNGQENTTAGKAVAPETVPAKTIEPSVVNKSTVSLGVIADKTNNETGLKISGVSPKKLAAKLGLQPGDVLTNLGSYKIYDFNSYLHALTNFKAGDRTTLRIKRGKDDKEFAVEF